jgi:hypothetical protein
MLIVHCHDLAPNSNISIDPGVLRNRFLFVR